jgi:hypothetical protein
VLRGTLVEQTWFEDADRDARVRRIGRGSTVQVPVHRSHDVANAGHRVAISVHVYAPRLARMNFYPDQAALAG